MDPERNASETGPILTLPVSAPIEPEAPKKSPVVAVILLVMCLILLTVPSIILNSVTNGGLDYSYIYSSDPKILLLEAIGSVAFALYAAIAYLLYFLLTKTTLRQKALQVYYGKYQKKTYQIVLAGGLLLLVAPYLGYFFFADRLSQDGDLFWLEQPLAYLQFMSVPALLLLVYAVLGLKGLLQPRNSSSGRAQTDVVGIPNPPMQSAPSWTNTFTAKTIFGMWLVFWGFIHLSAIGVMFAPGGGGDAGLGLIFLPPLGWPLTFMVGRGLKIQIESGKYVGAQRALATIGFVLVLLFGIFPIEIFLTR